MSVCQQEICQMESREWSWKGQKLKGDYFAIIGAHPQKRNTKINRRWKCSPTNSDARYTKNYIYLQSLQMQEKQNFKKSRVSDETLKWKNMIRSSFIAVYSAKNNLLPYFFDDSFQTSNIFAYKWILDLFGSKKKSAWLIKIRSDLPKIKMITFQFNR